MTMDDQEIDPRHLLSKDFDSDIDDEMDSSAKTFQKSGNSLPTNKLWLLRFIQFLQWIFGILSFSMVVLEYYMIRAYHVSDLYYFCIVFRACSWLNVHMLFFILTIVFYNPKKKQLFEEPYIGEKQRAVARIYIYIVVAMFVGFALVSFAMRALHKWLNNYFNNRSESSFTTSLVM